MRSFAQEEPQRGFEAETRRPWIAGDEAKVSMLLCDAIPGLEKELQMTGGTKWIYFILSVATIVQVILCFSSMGDEMDLFSAFQALAMISAVWLFLPLLNYLGYLKRSDGGAPNTGGVRKRKYLLILITIALASLCFVNLYGEVRFNALLMSKYNGTPLSKESLIVIAVFWLFLPLVNLFEGMRTSKEKRLRMALVIAVYYFLWMLYFALNGTDTDEGSYESRRLYGQPLGMVIFSPVVLYGEFCLMRFERWLGVRKNPEAQGE